MHAIRSQLAVALVLTLGSAAACSGESKTNDVGPADAASPSEPAAGAESGGEASGTEESTGGSAHGPSLPVLAPAPTPVVELTEEILAGLEAKDKEALDEVAIDFETYSEPHIFKGLLKTPNAAKLGPKFLWDDMSEDSVDDRDRLVVDYGDKKLELVSVAFGEHEDKADIEVWDDIVVTMKVDGTQQTALILGEFIKDKKSGQTHLLRFHRRRSRSQ